MGLIDATGQAPGDVVRAGEEQLGQLVRQHRVVGRDASDQWRRRPERLAVERGPAASTQFLEQGQRTARTIRRGDVIGLDERRRRRGHRRHPGHRAQNAGDVLVGTGPVSYTHLTLPTNREV